MEIQQMAQEDIPAVRKLLAKGSPYVAVYSDYVYWMMARYERNNCFLAKKDGEITGVLIALEARQRECLFIWQIVTEPRMRRQGIGKSLLACAAQRAAYLGLPALEIGIDPKNKPCGNLLIQTAKEWNSQITVAEEYGDQEFSEIIFRVKFSGRERMERNVRRQG